MILFYWVVRSSLMASILVVFILILKLMLRDRLGAKWHYYIWFLVLLRLAIPLNLQSPVSIFNYFSTPIPAPVYTDTSRPNDFLPQLQERTTGREAGDDALASNPGPIPDSNSFQAEPTAPPPSRVSFFNLRMLYSIWIAGVFALLLSMLFINLKFWSTLKDKTDITDDTVAQLFEGCKRKMGIRKKIPLIQTDTVKTTTLFGFIRPRLLLPANITTMLSFNELRYIFFHELAHIKQKDIAINLMVGLLQILHWFNPVLWYGFYRMRQDREVACDALALSYIHPQEYKDYGKVIIDLLDKFSSPVQIPGMIGIVSDGSNIKKRITMISLFKKNSYRLSVAAVVLLTIFGILFLTNANEAVQAERRGNTVGNILNEGLVAQEGDWIYYSNYDDGEKLYKRRVDGSDDTLLSEDTLVRYINVLDGWVYYNSSPFPITANFKGPFLYKISVDGSGRTRLTDHNVSNIQVVEDWIYYTSFDFDNRRMSLYRIKVDGDGQALIAQDIWGPNVVGGWVYYTKEGGIYKIRIDGTGETHVCEDRPSSFINVVGDWVYYCMGFDEPGIYKIRTDGSNRSQLSDDSADYLNVSGEYIFYESGGFWFNLYRMKTDGSQSVRITNHQSRAYNIIGDWLYYSSPDGPQKIPVDAPEAESREREEVNQTQVEYDMFKIAIAALGHAPYRGDEGGVGDDMTQSGVEEVYYNKFNSNAGITYRIVPVSESWEEIFLQAEPDLIRLFAKLSWVEEWYGYKLFDTLHIEISVPIDFDDMRWQGMYNVNISWDTLVNTWWGQVSVGDLRGLLEEF